MRRGWLCKLLARPRLPLSPSLRRGRGGRGVRGSGLGVAFTTSLQLSAGSSPHPGVATPLPRAGRGELGGVGEVVAIPRETFSTGMHPLRRLAQW